MALILDGTNGLSDVDGTAGTPAIRGSDANTGIFFPAADTIAFAEGGVESARFDANGVLGIGVTPNPWSPGIALMDFRANGGIANFSGNNVNLSDRREKTNFAPAKSYLETICAIPVQTFNYIDQNHEEDPGLTLGVVAQDVQAVAPELVMESNWGTEEDPKMRLSIYQTDLQYALMKCIQEQQAIIQSLTARIEALENQT